MAIYLIRHGETAANSARVVQKPDVALSERGRVQAERLAQRLADSGIARIVASDLTRAAETAEALRRATGARMASDALLQERNFGDLRGIAYADLDVDLFGPECVPPAGESWGQFHARVDRAWERIGALAAELSAETHLAVVTHGLVCHSLATRHLEGAAAASEASGLLRFGNTSLTVVRASPPWRIELFNCTAHLDADPSAAPRGISGL